MTSYQSSKKFSEPPLSQCPEPIAVVGMGCRLPGHVCSPSQLWDLLVEERWGQSNEVPKTRFNMDAYFSKNPDRPGSFNVPGGYFIEDDIRNFDPTLFGISNVEAKWLDPQQRKILEVVYEAFENAGLTLDDVSGSKTGCYIASFTADYQQISIHEPDFRHSYAATGVDPGIISARVSSIFNLQGPAFVINTACSSSVYALHNAIHALRSNEINAAVVGGVNLIVTVDQHINTAKLGVLSPTSTCHTFDASADGYGRADGVGALYVMRLSDAIRDRMPIRAVIRGTATNTNGKPLPGLGITNPSKDGQERVIRAAYKNAGGLNPLLCGYFECHGTGTPVGDPIEVEAVFNAMNGERAEDDPLWIGTVKPNIGHSEAASGIAAVMKAVLAVEAGKIPAVKGFKTPNPAIDFKKWKVRVVEKLTSWPETQAIRRASVNSFGYGGSNAHVIVEAVDSILMPYASSIPKQITAPSISQRQFLLPFAAHDKPTLKRIIRAYNGYVKKRPARNVIDIAYTLSAHRSLLKTRGFVMSRQDNMLEVIDESNLITGDVKERESKLGFVFTGQGAQWARMGVELMEAFPSVARTVNEMEAVLRRIPDGPKWTIKSALSADASTSKINEVQQSQLLCSALQICIVKLLREWGIKPVATVGHSSGEIAAAFTAGYLSQSEAVLAAYYRGVSVASRKQDGAMMAVGLGKVEVIPFLEGVEGVVVACQNSSQSVTLSGDATAIREVEEKLQAVGVFNRILKTDGRAYHSHHMKEFASGYKGCIASAYETLGIKSKARPMAAMISSVTGKALGRQELGADYWVSNLTNPVLFDAALEALLDDNKTGVTDLIEIGPHSALAGPVRQVLAGKGITSISYSSSLLRGKDSVEQLLQLAGKLFTTGYNVDLKRVNAIETLSSSASAPLVEFGTLLTDLPTYQWDYKQKLFGESRWSEENRNQMHGRHDILGRKVPGGSRYEPLWRNILRRIDLPWLADHRLGPEDVFPAAGYWAMAIEALQRILEERAEAVVAHSFTLRDVSIREALIIPSDQDGIEVLFAAKFVGDWMEFKVSSIYDNVWKEHCEGRIAMNVHDEPSPIRSASIALTQKSTGKRWYETFNNVGFRYGPSLQGIDKIRTNAKVPEATAETVIKTTSGNVLDESRYLLHPASMDSALHVVLIAIPYGQTDMLKSGFVPVFAEEITAYVPKKPIEQTMGSTYACIDREGGRSRVASVQLTHHKGELLLEIFGLKLMAFEAALPPGFDGETTIYDYWHATWKPDLDLLNSKQATAFLQKTSSPEEYMASLAELYIFKHPSAAVLEIVEDNISVAPKLQKIFPDIVVTSLSHRELAERKEAASAYNLIVSTNAATTSDFDLFRTLLVTNGTAAIICPGPVFLENLIVKGSDFTEKLKIEVNGKSVVVYAEPEIYSAATSDSGFEESNKVYVVYESEEPDISKHISFSLGRIGQEAQPIKLEDMARESSLGKRAILLDIATSALSRLDGKVLESVKSLLAAEEVLWVTDGGLLTGKRPEFSMPTGLARSLKSERASLNLTLVDFDLDAEDPLVVADVIVSCLTARSKPSTIETEFRVADGTLYISRLLETDGTVAVAASESTTVVRRFDTPVLNRHELETDVVFFEDSSEPSELGDWDVEVDVKAVSIFPEALKNHDCKRFSAEFSGVVIRVGRGVSTIKAGESVLGLAPNAGKQTQVLSAEFVHQYDRSLVGEYARTATAPRMYTAAYHALHHLARVTVGETLLVLPGTESVGFAAITIGRLAGASVFTTASSNEEARSVVELTGLHQDHVLVTSKRSMNATVRVATSGKGFDMVIATAADELASDGWRTIAQFGRFVELQEDNSTPTGLSKVDGRPFTRDACFLSLSFMELVTKKPTVVKQSFAKAMELICSGSIQLTAPMSVHGLGNLSSLKTAGHGLASEIMSLNYEVDHDSLTINPPSTASLFSSSAIYLLVGCLGGIGRSLSSWMIDNGARHLVFMGRSGASSAEASDLVRNIQSRGVTVTVIRGDASNVSDVETARTTIESLGKPLKGIFQAAMVLADGMFDSMSASAFNTAVHPKFLGTRNLHNVFLEHPLDFFVMTSSISATLGTPGQTNYSAGNNYLDALALHRRTNGKPATSLILPMILGIGYVADHPEIEDALTAKGLYGIEEAELLEAFKTAVLAGTLGPEQIVVGMSPRRLSRALKKSSTNDAFWLETPLISHVSSSTSAISGSSASSGSDSGLLPRLASATSREEMLTTTIAHIAGRLSSLLLIPEDSVEGHKSVYSYGLDSMIGTQLRNWVFKEFAIDRSMQHLLSPTLTVEGLAREGIEGLGFNM